MTIIDTTPQPIIEAEFGELTFGGYLDLINAAWTVSKNDPYSITIFKHSTHETLFTQKFGYKVVNCGCFKLSENVMAASNTDLRLLVFTTDFIYQL